MAQGSWNVLYVLYYLLVIKSKQVENSSWPLKSLPAKCLWKALGPL